MPYRCLTLTGMAVLKGSCPATCESQVKAAIHIGTEKYDEVNETHNTGQIHAWMAMLI